MPFNFIASEPTLCENALFIDVDYKLLIEKKCEIIRNTPQLRNVIPDLDHTRTATIALSSSKYRAVACDLEEVAKLNSILMEELGLEGCSFLFVAEVSITYMVATAAASLLSWAATLEGRRHR